MAAGSHTLVTNHFSCVKFKLSRQSLMELGIGLCRWSCRNTEAEVQMNEENKGGGGEERGRESEGVGVAGKEGGERDAVVVGGNVDAAQAQEEEQEGVKKKKKKKSVSEGENGVVELGEEVVEGGEVNGAKRKRKSEGGENREKEKKRKSL